MEECFYVFKIVQMVPNRATHHIWNYFKKNEIDILQPRALG